MKRDVLLTSAGVLAAGALAWLLWGHPEPGSHSLKTIPGLLVERGR
jgi:hypothetical protein